MRFRVLGYVTLENGKPGIAIAEVMVEPVQPSDETASQFHIPGTGDLARLRIYERKLLRHFSVGSTYEMEANDKSIRPSTARWQGRYTNDEAVRTWQAMADAYEIAECARKAEAAEKRTDLNFEVMEPFRSAWLQTNGIGGWLWRCECWPISECRESSDWRLLLALSALLRPLA